MVFTSILGGLGVNSDILTGGGSDSESPLGQVTGILENIGVTIGPQGGAGLSFSDYIGPRFYMKTVTQATREFDNQLKVMGYPQGLQTWGGWVNWKRPKASTSAYKEAEKAFYAGLPKLRDAVANGSYTIPPSMLDNTAQNAEIVAYLRSGSSSSTSVLGSVLPLSSASFVDSSGQPNTMKVILYVVGGYFLLKLLKIIK